MSQELRIGFLGAGKMATALAKGFLKAGLVRPENVRASDPLESARASFAAETGGGVESSNAELLSFATVLFLAVKPDQVDVVLADIRSGLRASHLLISVAAGVSLARLQEALPVNSRVLRAMPNTPALVGASATAFAPGQAARAEDSQLLTRLFTAVGLVCQVKEPWLDAVTGLSGSGPAYVFLMIEALSDGGVAAGLPRDIATRLAAQTLLGGAKMVLETSLHPGALKDMVTSPGGTTVEGLQELEKGKVRAALIGAVRAAADKSRRLGGR